MGPITVQSLPSTAADLTQELVFAAFPRDAERSWTILDGRLGLASKRRTLQELADAYEVSRERIRQIESQILARLNSVIGESRTTAEVALREDFRIALGQLHGLVPDG